MCHTIGMSLLNENVSTTGSFTPIRPASLVASVHAQIREAILGGRIRSGDEVRDSVLASQMQVSRAPVREALRLLQQSGLVEKVSHKPYRVKSFDDQDLRELAVLRIAIETTAVRLVVAQQRDITEVQAVMPKFHHAWEQRSDTELDAADWQFHRAIVSAAGIERLKDRYAELVDQIILAWQLHSESTPRAADNSVDHHEQLLESLRSCIASGDSAPFQHMLVDHIKSGMGCADLKI